MSPITVDPVSTVPGHMTPTDTRREMVAAGHESAGKRSKWEPPRGAPSLLWFYGLRPLVKALDLGLRIRPYVFKS